MNKELALSRTDELGETCRRRFAGTALADYLVSASTRELPTAVVEKTTLHIIDSVAAAVSGTNSSPGSGHVT